MSIKGVFPLTVYETPIEVNWKDRIKLWWADKRGVIQSGQVWNRKKDRNSFVVLMDHSKTHVMYYYLEKGGENYCIVSDKTSFFKTWEKTGWQK